MTAVRPLPRRPVLEAFEPRILYSADLAAVAQSLVGASAASVVVDQQLQSTVAAQQSALHEIAFVDVAVPDAERLIAGLQAQREAGRPIEVWRIDAGQDGVTLIGQVLAQQAPGSVSAVHVFSHGSAGAVQLGSTRLDADAALSRAADIAAWSPALTADADLLLYGCDVAANDKLSGSHSLISTLAVLSGADVAASDNLTGSAALGGDWVLEQHTGTIDTAVAPSAQTQAAWLGTLGVDTQVNSTLTGQQDTQALNRGSQQAVALDASGNFVVVWTSKNQDGDGDGVYARRYSADGVALTSEIRVNSRTDGDQNSARVVCDAAGNFVVVWTADRSDSSNTQVMLRRFSGSGTALTGEVQANTTGSGSQADAVVAMNSSTGAFTVAWQGKGPGDTQGIFFRRFTASAAAIDTVDQRANATDQGNEQNASIAIDSTGRFAISWDVSDRVYVQRFGANGVAQGGATQVGAPLLAGLLSSGSGAAIAMDDAGHYAIAYREKTALYEGIWTATFNADGSQRSSWLRVDASSDASNASLDMAADGSYAVVYDKTGVSGRDVYLRNHLADGSASGSAELVNATTTGDQEAASVSVRNATQRVVVWSGKSADDAKGVVFKAYGLSGSAPVITSNGGDNPPVLLINEGLSAVTTVTASDADPGTELRYSIVGGVDAGRFSIDAITGALRFNVITDFENPVDDNFTNRYHVVVQASDGMRVDRQHLIVSVQDVNEFNVGPLSDSNSAANQVSELAAVDTLVGITATASDSDGSNNTITYSLIDSAGGRFKIGSSSGKVSVAGGLDFETATSHQITVLATSSDRSTSTRSFTIQVLNANEGDVGALRDALSGTANAVVENAVAGTSVGIQALATDPDTGDTVRYSLLTVDGVAAASSGRFNIDAVSGVISVGSVAPDAEAQLTHELLVQATSSDGSKSQQTYLISVLDDPNEHAIGPVSDSDAADNVVREDAAVGSTVGVTALASDADVTLSGVRYALVGASSPFAVDAQTGQVTLTRSVDGDSASSWRLTVLATSEDGSTAQQAFDVSLVRVNTHAPVITTHGGAADVALSVDEGTAAVTTVQASDADLPAPTLSYSVAGGADAAAFVLDAATGELRFAQAPDAEVPRDAQQRNVYEVVVRASDGERTSEQTLHITVRPVNDNTPEITSDGGGSDATLTVDENQTAVTTVVARDADLPAATLHYTVAAGADGDRFSIDPRTGVLRFVNAPDLEAPQDANSDGQWEVVVRASDGERSSDQTLHVRLRNVDEAPVLLRHGLTITEGGSAVPDVMAQDVDSAPEALRYSVQGLSGGRFEAVAAPGVALLSFTQADVNAGRIRFVSDGGEAAPAYELQLSDGVNSLAAQAANVSYTHVDDAPQAADVDLGRALEDTPRFITRSELLAGASDAESDPLTLSDVHVLTGEGVLTDLGGGVWRFDPTAQWSGAVSLGYRVDDGVLASTGTARFAVMPVNDAPVITSHGGASVVELSQAENTVAVDTLTASDLDATGPLRWRVSGGADAGRFVIDPASGALRWASAANFELASDADRDNVYEVTVAASDGELSASQTLRVTVTNVDEAPTITANALLLSDGQITVVLRAADEDTGAAQLQYTVAHSTGGHFEHSTVPGSVVLNFSQAEVDAGLLRFVADGSATTPAYTLSLSDGHSSVAVAAPTLVDITTPVAASAPAVQATPVDTVSAPQAPATAAATTASANTASKATTTTAANSAGRSTTAAAETGVATASPGSTGDSGADGGAGAGRDALFSAGVPGAGPIHVAGLAPLVRPDAVRGLQAVSAESGLWGEWRQTTLNEASTLAPAYALGEGSGAAVRAGLIDALDRLRHAVQQDAAEPELTLGAPALLTTTGLSVGYALWLARGGVLVASLMSSIPSWASMDPLPVLSQMREGGEGDDDDPAGGAAAPGEIDPIEELFSRARRWVAKPALPQAPAPTAPSHLAELNAGPQQNGTA